MTTENPSPFKGREFRNLVFDTTRNTCIYRGLYEWQKKKWLQDHPESWKTRENALCDLQAHSGADLEAEPVEPCSISSAEEVRPSGQSDCTFSVTAEDKQLPDNPATSTALNTIARLAGTAAAGDEIIVEDRRFLSESRVAAMLGYSQRQLQRWRKEHNGPPSTKVGRRWYYEMNKLRKWIERQNSH
jgi:Helix-turn-helix domain